MKEQHLANIYMKYLVKQYDHTSIQIQSQSNYTNISRSSSYTFAQDVRKILFAINFGIKFFSFYIIIDIVLDFSYFNIFPRLSFLILISYFVAKIIISIVLLLINAIYYFKSIVLLFSSMP